MLQSSLLQNVLAENSVRIAARVVIAKVMLNAMLKRDIALVVYVEKVGVDLTAIQACCSFFGLTAGLIYNIWL